jgi:hypothetical protein
MQIPLIHPESRFKIYWEVYLLIMTVAVTIVAPLMVVFQLTMTPVAAGVRHPGDNILRYRYRHSV